ncbi:MAG: protein kinase [Phycisphaerales bacterium]|nr:protein kinase [Phycisphaerales bacterium]
MMEPIGPYEISRELGRGGMGVVYLAMDTHLDRLVAIKALPAELAADPARLERFEREAKTLAQLNHPNLAGIHGIEEQDCAKYLVLEFVEGESLADRLDRGPIPQDEAVEYAVQIAAGIEAAHDAGVIHRDLKPANVMVTPDGQVKVLDFGLARTDDGGQSSTGVLDSPTMTQQPQHSPTIAGAILGTAAYMSPEQARGRRVDKRTDIWSFGVILYEMLVGASPFQGETASDSIGAVLHKDLDLDRLPRETPSRVRMVLERCLVRDRNLRYRDIGDVRVELLRSDDGGVPSAVGSRSLPVWIVPVGALALIAVAAGVWFAKPSPQPAPAAVVQADITLPGDRLLAHAFMPGIAMSADGRTLAYSAGIAYSEEGINDDYAFFEGDLFVRRLSEADAVPVPGAESAWQPTFSPDGLRIAYVRREGRFSGNIETIAVTGGRPTQLTTESMMINGIDWTDDGRIIFGTREGLRSVPEGGGPVTNLTEVSKIDTEMTHAFPKSLPGGRAVLYTVAFDRSKRSPAAIRVLDRTSGESHELLTDASNARYTQGHIVFSREHTLHAVPFDLETLALRGEPRPLGMSVIQSLEAPNTWAMNSAAQFAVSATGDLVYAQGSIWPELPSMTVWVNRDGEVEETIETQPGAFNAPRIDPEGRRLLLSNFYHRNSAIWVHDTDRGVSRRVHQGNTSWVAWGPGPDDYTFHTSADGVFRVGWATIGDTAEPFILASPPDSRYFLADGWSADRQHLICTSGEWGNNIDIYAWSQADGWINVTDSPGVDEAWPNLSPDGRWIAYIAIGSDGESWVYVKPFLRDGPAIQVSSTDSSSPLWSADGTELYYISQEPAQATGAGSADPTQTERWVMAAAVTVGDSGMDIDRAVKLFSADDYSHLIPIRSWDMGPDGRFLMSRRPSEDVTRSALDAFFPNRIRLIQNWANTLRSDEH